MLATLWEEESVLRTYVTPTYDCECPSANEVGLKLASDFNPLSHEMVKGSGIKMQKNNEDFKDDYAN